MKVWSIILYVICLQLAVALVNDIGVFSHSVTPYLDFTNSVSEQALHNDTYLQSQISGGTAVDFGFGDFVKGLFFFIGILAWGMIYIAGTWINFGVPVYWAWLLSMPVYVVYAIAIVQMISGRAGEQMT
jgi:hypothetical protein